MNPIEAQRIADSLMEIAKAIRILAKSVDALGAHVGGGTDSSVANALEGIVSQMMKSRVQEDR